MNRLIRDVFELHCAKAASDSALPKHLRMYESGFVSKNSDHIQFFGGHLLGVHPVKFLPNDKMRWFDEIIQADELVLRNDLYELPTIHQDWIVSSDIMNLSAAWLVHQIFTSKLAEADKHQAMIDVVLILQYKLLTSLLSHYFRYPASQEVAEATYAALSDKFTIKQLGNWKALLQQRAEDVISKDSPHYQTIVKMDNDTDVIYMLNDIQGRIRDIIKNIYAVFDRVHKSGVRHSIVSSVVEYDGEEVLKDRTKSLIAYTRYLNSVVSDKPSFIRAELVDVVEKLVYTAPPAAFKQTLNWISEHYREARYGLIEEVLNETLIHSFAYLAENREYVKGNPHLPELLGRLKGVYTSSRSTDPALMKLREQMEQIVAMATESKNDSVLAAVRTATLLYLVARTLTMRHYAS
jgi:hypothetical protein